MYKKIKTLAELKLLASDLDNPLECFIHLSSGLRSSKVIKYNTTINTWNILHEIDDCEEDYDDDETMLNNTNIGKALSLGSLYEYD